MRLDKLLIPRLTRSELQVVRWMRPARTSEQAKCCESSWQHLVSYLVRRWLVQHARLDSHNTSTGSSPRMLYSSLSDARATDCVDCFALEEPDVVGAWTHLLDGALIRSPLW